MAVVEGRMYCDKCQEPIDRPREAWYETVGWAKQRSQGGLHSLTLARKTDTVVCSACMVRMKLDEQHGPGASPLF